MSFTPSYNLLLYLDLGISIWTLGEPRSLDIYLEIYLQKNLFKYLNLKSHLSATITLKVSYRLGIVGKHIYQTEVENDVTFGL